MSITFAYPSALWWLAAIPLLWLVTLISRPQFGPRQRVLQVTVRSALLALLAMALAQPVWSSLSSRLSVVYLVDISHSIAASAILDAAARIDDLNARIRPETSRILAFGTHTEVLHDAAALRALAVSEPGQGADPFGRDGSDLEAALAGARAEFRPGDTPRIVLMSDGRETKGDLRTATLRLAAEGVPVFTEPLAVRDLGDGWVDGLQVPDVVPAGTLVTITPLIGSQRQTRDATVEIRESNRVLATRQVSLEPGLTPVAMDVTFPTAGPHVVDISLAVAGDVLAANNHLTREVLVAPRTRALYVEGAPASAHYLESALAQSGFDVTRRTTAEIPARSDDFNAYDVVILSDVARSAVSDAAARAIATWVERDGGGVFFAGGDAVFGDSKDEGAPGYRHSEIERLLPVTFERRDEPGVALVMVLDKSWSMNGPVIELCKAAAQAAVDVLTDEQVVGVITFDDRFSWDLTPRPVGANRDEIRRKISAIRPGGDTLIYPALEQAYLMLNKTSAGAKHVVLLSDGRSYPDDYQGLLKKMVDARITVSSIAVGPEADAELLTNIATWGKGRGYIVRDAHDVPEIFVKEAKDAMSAFDEGGAILPVVKAPRFLEHVDLAHVPELRGRTALVMKDQATELLSTPQGDPLLAFWPIGLGRTAAFASDVNDRWAAAWVTWPGYAPFFSTMIRALARQHDEPVSLDVTGNRVHGRTRAIDVSVEVRDTRGRYRDLLNPSVVVRSADGFSATAPARQVAPGRYEASVSADADQPLTVSLADTAAVATPARYVIPDADAEYRFRPPNENLLRAIASATGGVYVPSAADLAKPTGARGASKRAAWPWLVGAALIGWLVDIWLRRIRFA